MSEIDCAALTLDDPEVEIRQLSLEDVVEQLTYDFVSDTHGGWENNDGAWGELPLSRANLRTDQSLANFFSLLGQPRGKSA